MTGFAFATLMPVPLLLLAVLFGGWWALLALIYTTLSTFVLDEWPSLVAPPGRWRGISRHGISWALFWPPRSSGRRAFICRGGGR